MKKRKFISVFIVSIVLIFACIQNVFAMRQDSPESNGIETLIQDFKNDTSCEEVSVVIYDKGDVTYYGDGGALYQIGSMTKTFTGLAVQKLITEGRVDEDMAIASYIPGFEAYYDGELAEITVRNLLEQKSGFTNSEKDYPSAEEGVTLSEWADGLSGCSLSSKPGTEYAYSNVNYNLLGLIIENVTGKSYKDYMEQEILIPLGLANTFVGTPTDGRIIEGTRLGYRHVFNYPMTVKEARIPAGYFYSNTEDMGRWIAIWTDDGVEDSVVPEELREPLAKVKETFKNEGDYYSGWELFADGVIGHSGGTPQYSSRIVFDETKNIGVCVLCNLNVAATTDSLCNNIYDILAGKGSGELATDIWTIFDKIFISVTIVGGILLIVLLALKKRAVILILGAFLLLLLVLVLVLFPIIFRAGMMEIMFIWAPLSLTGGLLILMIDTFVAIIKLMIRKKNADYNKAD